MKLNSARVQLRAEIASTTRALRDPILATWALYLLLVPAYIYASGLPQPGDWVLLILAPLVLRSWNGRLNPMSRRSLQPLILFVGYVTLANLIWSFVLNAWKFGLKGGLWMSPLFYIYNGLAFLLVLVMYRRYGEKLLKFTANLVLATVVLQAGLAFLLGGGGGGRVALFFNNPNQLGYFALLSISILFLLHRRHYITTLPLVAGALASSYLALLSASKSALAGILLIALAGAMVRVRTVLVIGVAFGLAFATMPSIRDAAYQTIDRYDTSKVSSFAEDRGYDRITENPEYLLFGAGEGAYERYRHDSILGPHEIHSSIGTLVFCYGIVGTMFFLAFIWTTLRGSGFRSWLLVSPSIVYGLGHQGLRTTLFWVLLALVVVLRDASKGRQSARAYAGA